MSNDAADVHKKSALTVALCFLVAVVEGFGLQVMSAIGPLIRGPLHLDPKQLGFIFSSSLVGLGIGAIIALVAASRGKLDQPDDGEAHDAVMSPPAPESAEGHAA